MKKLFSTLLTIILLLGEMQGQVLPLFPLVPLVLGPKQKIHIFKSIDFDASYSLIGVDADTALALKKYCFQINSPAVIQRLKKDWYVRYFSKSELGKQLFKIYAIKDKEIKEEWIVFPLDSAIYAAGDYYRFDASLLEKASLEYPFVYEMKVDTFTNYGQFTAFKKTSQTDSHFLFLINPRVGYDGNFEVKAEKNDGAESMDETVQHVQKYCSKVAGKSKYAIYRKSDGNTGNDASAVVFIIKSDRAFYDQFNSNIFIKDKWSNELLIVQSYWKK